jgi:tripartite ATP-independent transporter DctM subunit
VAALAVDHYRVVVNPTLPAIPLFTLAGYFLAEAEAPARLVRLFKALFASFRGGGAIAAVVASSVLTCLTGASGVTILALGGLLLPFLVSLRYSERSALGLVTGAGLPGILLLPSMPLILFAIVAEVGIREMFLAGLLPALVMLALTAAWGIRQAPARAPGAAGVDWAEVRRAAAEAKWDLALPLVALGALFGGFASPVEAAAITALYAFAVQTFVYRGLRFATDVPRVTQEAGLLVGGVLLILGVALGLSNYLVDAQVPDRLVQWLEQRVHSRWLFLLALNLFLLGVGCLLDIFSAIIVVAPLVVPIGRAFDVDPIHLGIILLANLELGYLTPPVGLNLFFASYRFGKPIGEVFRSVASLLPVQLGGVLLITYVPVLALGLPGLFGSGLR